MVTFHEYIDEYKIQLERGNIQKAYKGLIEYVMALRTFFNNKYPDYFVSGSIYYGYMDMTYFSFTPKSLLNRKLKIAIVFIHEAVRFEIWLGGYNKQVQQKYWELFRKSNWNKYRIVQTTKEVDAIIEHVLVDHPNFSNLDSLTKQIEKESLTFIKDVEQFLTEAEI